MQRQGFIITVVPNVRLVRGVQGFPEKILISLIYIMGILGCFEGQKKLDNSFKTVSVGS